MERPRSGVPGGAGAPPTLPASSSHLLAATFGTQASIVLASSVAARAVTLPSMKYVLIHPHTRTSVLHSSGILELVDERVDA